MDQVVIQIIILSTAHMLSGKHVDDFHTIDYQALIPILINSVKELNDEIKILKDKINILESNKI